MPEAVLDASAVLAILRGETGAEEAGRYLAAGAISAVNAAEVVSRLIDFGVGPEMAAGAIRGLDLAITPLDAPMALEAGVLRKSTRAQGLSLGDRACLATAKVLCLPAVTADRAWASLDLGVEVVLIR
jgi:PIN domain nuclease of toxin-antitoxin system